MHTTNTRFTSVRCTYRSTLYCILKVSARELSSGSEAQITISEAMRLGEEEVERMVREAELMREEDEERAREMRRLAEEHEAAAAGGKGGAAGGAAAAGGGVLDDDDIDLAAHDEL